MNLVKNQFFTFMFDDKYFKCFEGIESQKIISCNQIDQLAYAKYISESGKFVKTDNFKSYPINLGAFNNEKPIIFINDQDKKNFYLSEEATYYFINKEIKKELVTFLLRIISQNYLSKENFLTLSLILKQIK